MRRLIGAALGLLLAAVPLGCREQQESRAGEYDLRDEVPATTQEQVRAAAEAVDEITRRIPAPPDWEQQPAQKRRFLQDIEVLCRNSHRLAGLDSGSVQAARYVENRLRSMGVKEVAVQKTPVVQAVARDVRLIAAGEQYRLYACRPNNVHASVTPPGGLSGKTVYVGRGELSDYGPRDPRGRIVVMDFDCGTNWRQAFAFGAKAVVFVGPEDPNRPAGNAYQHVNVPADLPRFYVTHAIAEQLGLTRADSSRPVTIQAAAAWRELYARNVIGVLRGTDPFFGEGQRRQAVVLAAPLDTYGEVPRICPGARDAGNVAALLQIAEYLLERRPRRDVVLLFADGQAQNHLGARAFYGAIYRKTQGRLLADQTLAERMASLVHERAYYQGLLAILRQPDIFNFDPEAVAAEAWPDADTHKKAQLLRDVRTSAFRSDGVVRDQQRLLASGVLRRLRSLRLERRDLRLELSRARVPSATDGAGEDSNDLAAPEGSIEQLRHRLDELETKVHTLARTDRVWNAVARILYERIDVFGNPKEVRSTVRELYDGQGGAEERRRRVEETLQRVRMLIERTRAACRRRIDEIEETLDATYQGMLLANSVGQSRSEIVLHLGLKLGDARRRWTFIHGDDTNPAHPDPVGDYTGIFKMIENTGRDGSFPLFDPRAVSGKYGNRLFGPPLFADSTAVARIFGRFNLSITTVMDPLARQGQPADRLDALHTDSLYAQVAEVKRFLADLCSRKGLDISSKARAQATFVERDWSDGGVSGAWVSQAGVGSAMADLPVPGAVVSVNPNVSGGASKLWQVERFPPGIVQPLLCKTDIDGSYEIGPFSSRQYSNSVVLAAKFDEPLPGAAQSGQQSRGRVRFISTARTAVVPYGGTGQTVEVFPCRPLTFVGYGWDRMGMQTKVMRALSTSPFQRGDHLRCESDNIAALYAPRHAEGVKLFNRNGMVLLNNEPTEQQYQGTGLPAAGGPGHFDTTKQTAHDLVALNEYRLRLLRNNRISLPSLTRVNGEASDRFRQGTEAGPGTDGWDAFVGKLWSAAQRARKAYQPLVDTMNDLVVAVVFLLVMAIPFAFSLERLLIGTPHIYRQIGWFTGFFLLTFGVLFVVNPAFQIASTPLIIFLAFTIILLSALVIVILARKLQSEIRRMQGLRTTIHTTDVSRLNTMMAAVGMGVSTMRRRPVRTLLTAVTVVLLTFTILTFASFGRSWGVRRTYVGPASGPDRLVVHHPLWSPLAREQADALQGALKGRAAVVQRYWLSPTAQEAADAAAAGQAVEHLLASPDRETISLVSAGIGLDCADIRHQPELAGLLDGNLSLLDSDGLFTTRAVAEQLGLGPEDVGKATVLLRGRPLTFAGFVRRGMAAHEVLSGAGILPVDYAMSASEQKLRKLAQSRTSGTGGQPEMQTARFVEYNVNRVVILPPDVAREMGAEPRLLTIYPRQDRPVEPLAKDVASTTDVPVYYTRQGGVYRARFSSLTEASGWRDLVIPVTLGGLIVFATMMGSVSDREREVYTFSSLGLAPVHVSGLFFAEAGVYAIVGGMGGYLLGQAVARGASWLGAIGLVSVPRINYSSTNAIATVMVVMATVLVSTIWPAIKASRSANPGIQRRWRIPKPEGDLFDVEFPFTVSAYDITGVVSFLAEHFDNCTEDTATCFASLQNHVFRQKDNDMLGFHARAALVPFDLGVTQEFALLSQPSEIEGIHEVRILIRRLSGAPGDWRRWNRVFVNDLRKQLLIWRSLPPEIMEQYRKQTLDAWESLPHEQYTPEAWARLPQAPRQRNT